MVSDSILSGGILKEALGGIFLGIPWEYFEEKFHEIFWRKRSGEFLKETFVRKKKLVEKPVRGIPTGTSDGKYLEIKSSTPQGLFRQLLIKFEWVIWRKQPLEKLLMKFLNRLA